MAKKSKNQFGFTLVEVLLAVVILAIMSIGILGMFEFSTKVIAESKARIGAITTANEISEMAHNLSYNDVGTVGGLVSGIIPQTDTTKLNNINYTISVSVDYFDDPFDGTVEEETDEFGNDYKKVRIAVSWHGHFGVREVVSVTTIAPKGIESDQGSGVLWINAIDSSGQPVPNALIHIINHATDPPIDDSSHQTNEEGYYYSSVPASNSSYNITVTKDGYSSDYTCPIDPGGAGCTDTVGNPDPSRPDITVIESKLVRATFTIDQIAVLNIHTVSQTIPTEWTVNTDAGPADQYAPAIELASNGNYQFAWQDFRDYANRVYAQNYNQQTAEWNPDQAITTDSNQGAPHLATNHNNEIYYAWHDDLAGNQDIYVNKLDNNGSNLWGQPIKINTDGTSANQLYPKIVWNASTTAEYQYVSWKDERVGGNKSDIYLQKIDPSGNFDWPAEIKVNLNSSAMYQASDLEIFSFDNPLNYVCDGGNCDGSTSIEVSGGAASLVPIKTCDGTPDSCDSFLSSGSCTDQDGCTWDQGGPCEGSSCDCSLFDEEQDCEDADSCNWTPGTVSCYGNCSCSAIGSRSRCLSVNGCSWFWFFCYNNPGCNCEDIGSQTTCTDASCNWGAGGGSCDGSCSCGNLTTEPVCTQSGCSWDPDGPCAGEATVCENFLDQNTCINQQGCEWSEAGAGYPDDNPNIYLVESFVVNNLTSWDSFAETATKNGGEIYYQLSDDDGSSWKYWDGSNWVLAGASNYNTAAAINNNISFFPTVRQKIMFKAFFSSNGSQQIILDQIDIGYSYTTAGGGYSQSVDLAVDQDENVYLVWEDYQIDNYDIFIQKVNSEGDIVWPNDIRVNTYGDGDQNNPAIIVDGNDDIYVVWQDTRNGDSDIYAQKYDGNGNSLWPAGDIAVSISSENIQENPRIAADSDNNIYVVWYDGRNGDNDIYGQKVNSGGSIVWADDIRINSNTSGDQKNPDIIINQSGNLVVVWQDNNPGNYDIIAAEYPADPSAYTNTPNVPLRVWGEKQICDSPIIYKYDREHTTNASGYLYLTDMEWDTYSIGLQDGSGYTLINSEPPLPISVDPGQTIDVTINID